MSQAISNLAAGSLVRDPNSKYLGAAIVWKVADHNHSGYPAGSTTLITDKIIMTKAFDAAEASNANGNRMYWGNNRWKYSNLRQWLNKAATSWYEAQHSADAPPIDENCEYRKGGYATEAGFLSFLSPNFVKNLFDTTYSSILSEIDGGGTESVTDKIFLASKDEVGDKVSCDGAFPIFGFDNESRLAYMTAELVSFYNDLWKSDNYTTSTDTTHEWYLRDASYNSPSSLFGIGYSGSDRPSGHEAHCSRLGVRPLCNLNSSVLVSDAPDSEGCYTLMITPQGLSTPEIIVQDPIYCDPTYETGGITGGSAEITWGEVNGASGYSLERSINGGDFAVIYSGAERVYSETILSTMQSLQYRVRATDGTDYSEYATSAVRVIQDNFPPFISGDETSLGEKAYKFSYPYTLYDGDDVRLTVKEYINTTLIRTYMTNTGVQQTLELSSVHWGACSTGDNYIKIEAVDDNNATVSQTKHFTKLDAKLVVDYTPTGDTATQPKVINVELDLEKPFLSNLKIEACNNGNDTQPVYDDITMAVKTGINHIFTNTAKESGVSYWKVIIRITVTRNNADGDIKLKGVKCQLDCIL